MEEVRTFLDSSTIHGLAYISSTRKFIRVIWVLVVIAGFTGAGYMIYQSFKAWEESPVTTAVETLPITEITLPKVTVCPPKNTLTNLNYDLMMLENMTLDNDTRDELTQFAVGLIQDHVYNEVMRNISKLEEENRYYNWYMGYTKIWLPWWGPRDCTADGKDKDCAEDRLRYRLSTWATSGNISTQYFGHDFERVKMERELKYTIRIYPPSKYKKNKNITIHINIENNLLQEYDKVTCSPDIYTRLSRAISPPGSYKYYVLNRKISEDGVSDLQIDLMPGFRLTWHYNIELDPAVPAHDSSNPRDKFVR